MRVRFLKDHINHKQGDVVEASEGMANYWQRVGAVEVVKEKKSPEPDAKKEPDPEIKDKSVKPVTKNKTAKPEAKNKD